MVRGGLMVLNKSGEPYYVLGKKFSNSTLKSMTKDKLIECLDVAQHNYECSQNGIYNITKYAKKLDKALDRACEEIRKGYDCHYCNLKCHESTKKCEEIWRDYLMKGDKE